MKTGYLKKLFYIQLHRWRVEITYKKKKKITQCKFYWNHLVVFFLAIFITFGRFFKARNGFQIKKNLNHNARLLLEPILKID